MKTLKSLLAEAKTELLTLVKFVEGQRRPHVHLTAIKSAQKAVAERIASALVQAEAPLVWVQKDIGMHKASLGDLEILVYKDAGEWVWTVQPKDGKGPRVLRDAQDDAARAAWAAYHGKVERKITSG